MARLDEIRNHIVPASVSVSVMDAVPVQDAIVSDADEDDDDFPWPDEEDFQEALDLMGDTAKLLKAILGRVKLSSMSRHLIEKHRDALLQFIGDFPGQED